MKTSDYIKRLEIICFVSRLQRKGSNEVQLGKHEMQLEAFFLKDNTVKPELTTTILDSRFQFFKINQHMNNDRQAKKFSGSD